MSINTIITTLLTQLSKISPPPPPNPDYNIINNNIFTNLSATDTRQLKNLLLTLHCLFPNELLLALDILDRGFVRRYTYTSTSITADNKSDTKKREEEDTLIFIVQSTSSPSNLEREREREGSDGGGGGGGGGNAYQVHLKTWNCSCPAFVLGCFASTTNTANAESEMMTERQQEEEEEENNDMHAKEESWFGGTLRIPDSSYDDQSIPICKHILACVLVAKCPGLFGRKCLTYEVNDMGKINEVAGWCAA